MKTIISLLFTIFTINMVWSQDRAFERRRGFGESKTPRREMHHLRFVKNILSEKCIKDAQITPEQIEKLKKEFNLLDKEMFEIGKKVGDLSKKQAEKSITVLTNRGSDPAEMLKLTEEIGKLRTEQAKHSVKVLIVVRDTLNPEQCATVVKIMKEEREKSRKRMEVMREKMKNRREGEPGFERQGAFRKRPDFDVPPQPKN